MSASKRKSRALGMFLLLVGGGLIFGLVTEYGYALRWQSVKRAELTQLLEEAEPVPGDLENELPMLSLGMPDTDFFPQIVERPLFMSTRRPPVDEPEAVIAAVPEAPPPPPAAIVQARATLTSVMIAPNIKVALVKDSGGKTVRLEEGGEIEGWNVKAIEPDSVVLVQGNENQRLALRQFLKPEELQRRVVQTRNQDRIASLKEKRRELLEQRRKQRQQRLEERRKQQEQQLQQQQQ